MAKNLTYSSCDTYDYKQVNLRSANIHPGQSKSEEVPNFNPTTNYLKTNLVMLLDKVVYLRVVLDNDHPSVLDYGYELIKGLIVAFESNTQN